ncbi:hypothetical protein COB57_03615 [Candidatus Peregrinibacteria bacterium]|nr:MAG: hypothetical protein COB57_03615 [Candidatus Peregrinibacteria bacterium]
MAAILEEYQQKKCSLEDVQKQCQSFQETLDICEVFDVMESDPLFIWAQSTLIEKMSSVDEVMITAGFFIGDDESMNRIIEKAKNMAQSFSDCLKLFELSLMNDQGEFFEKKVWENMKNFDELLELAEVYGNYEITKQKAKRLHPFIMKQEIPKNFL